MSETRPAIREELYMKIIKTVQIQLETHPVTSPVMRRRMIEDTTRTIVGKMWNH